MPPSVRQTNFGAGELSPLLWGRNDLPIFGRGTRTLRNFFVSKQGAAVSRPGTEFVMEGREIGGISGPFDRQNRLRLIPFYAGDDIAYLLVFGHLSVQFVSLGEQVLAGGVAYTVQTPYTFAEVAGLKYAQTGDILTLVHPNHDARELRIYAPANWKLTTVNLGSPFAGWFDESIGDAVSLEVDVLASSIPTPDADHPAREWQWMVSVLLKRASDGVVLESQGKLVIESWDGADHVSNAALPALIGVYPDQAVTLNIFFNGGASVDEFGDYRFVAVNFYRGRGGLFGFIGQTTSDTFIDVGDEPDYATQPPLGTQPFGTTTQADPTGFATGDDPNGDKRHLDRPSTVGFFQERRVFDDGLKAGQLHFSQTGDYFNFDARLLIHVAGESLDVTLAARKREEIRALLPRQRLLVFTGSSVWSIGGSQGSPIDFDDIDARVEDETGATHLQPIVADGATLYARARGLGVRALVTDGQQFSFQGVDLSQIAQHLFVGKDHDIVDWCFAQEPWGVVWAVRADGALLSLTYEKDGWGWARHDTSGVYEAVCSVPEGDEDAVYVVVRRSIGGRTKRYVERMTSRIFRGNAWMDADGNRLTDPTYPELWPDGICIDCALDYAGVPVTGFTGLAALEGMTNVYVIARGQNPAGPFTVTGGVLNAVYDEAPAANALDGGGLPIFVARVGVGFKCQLETLGIVSSSLRMQKKTVSRIGFEVDNAVGLQVGQDFDHLDEWIQRTAEEGFNPISMATELVDMPVDSNWDQEARACLQQAAPQPVTVVGLTREVEIGD